MLDFKSTKNFSYEEMIKSTTWVESLTDQGFTSPVIKEIQDNGKQLWFISDGVDYVGNILSNGHIFVEKATFANPTVSYAPAQTTKKRLERDNVQGEPYMGDTIEDAEDN